MTETGSNPIGDFKAFETDGVKFPPNLIKMTSGDYDGPAVIANFDPSHGDGSALYFASVNPGEKRISDLKSEPFSIRFWLCETTEYQDEKDDEQRFGLRISMWDENGVHLTASSSALARALDRLRIIRGYGPYDPPFKIKFVEVKTGRGRTTYRCEMVK